MQTTNYKQQKQLAATTAATKEEAAVPGRALDFQRSALKSHDD